MLQHNVSLAPGESENRLDRIGRPADGAVRVTAARDGLPRVQDLRLQQFGVRQAHVEVAYLHRDKEAELTGHLAARRPVLVVGDSMSGKTRMAAEVLRREYARWPMVVPVPPHGLADLAAGDALPHGSVVWLDDLERYLEGRALGVELIDRLQRQDCLLIATLRSSTHQMYRPGEGPRSAQAELLERFAVVRLQFDDDEQQRLAAEIRNPSLRAGVLRYGLAEYVGAGYLAVQRYVAGLGEHPLGAALVRAAVDWRRAGMDVVPEAVLTTVAGAYLPARRHPAETVAEGLSWACARIDNAMELLERVDGGRRASDYIVDHLAKSGTPIPDVIWAAIEEACSVDDAVRVGYIAYILAYKDVAVTLWRRAADAGHPDARYNLGVLRPARGEVVEPEAAREEPVRLDTVGRDPACPMRRRQRWMVATVMSRAWARALPSRRAD